MLSAGSLVDHLDVVVFGASDHQVLVVSRLIHGQTHDWTQVADELPGGSKPFAKRRSLKCILKTLIQRPIQFQPHCTFSTVGAEKSCFAIL